MSKQSRCIAMTLNNYSDTECPQQLLEDITYACWGEEVAPTTGTKHLQGVIYFKKKTTIKGIVRKNYFDGKHPHYVLCRGSLQANITYCRKDGRFYEYGELPATPGEIGGRMEIDRWEAIRQALVKPTVDFAKLAEAYPREVILSFDKMDRFRDRVRPDDVARSVLENYWITGPTGTGKTVKAKTYGDYYVQDDPNWVSPPFNYQPVLIFDEVTPYKIPFATLSKIADHHPYAPAFKGGFHRLYRPKIVVVTSNYTIEQCYPADAAAIRRRFQVIVMT